MNIQIKLRSENSCYNFGDQADMFELINDQGMDLIINGVRQCIPKDHQIHSYIVDEHNQMGEEPTWYIRIWPLDSYRNRMYLTYDEDHVQCTYEENYGIPSLTFNLRHQ